MDTLYVLTRALPCGEYGRSYCKTLEGALKLAESLGHTKLTEYKGGSVILSNNAFIMTAPLFD